MKKNSKSMKLLTKSKRPKYGKKSLVLRKFKKKIKLESIASKKKVKSKSKKRLKIDIKATKPYLKITPLTSTNLKKKRKSFFFTPSNNKTRKTSSGKIDTNLKELQSNI